MPSRVTERKAATQSREEKMDGNSDLELPTNANTYNRRKSKDVGYKHCCYT